ncbi:SDR family NAD(P)-dependent oxidoreductase [Alkalicoccus luteus]|uniref:SDR family NAD(P)-dependent oxidoreductase n=1 Tax=Alkalicoccus luteus TaxID=1237094 RepID=A0A969PN44_9BACI|nr:SDR family NAD(P)-dependent oxidoreductase [Alkalicoccus luteus]NJP37265.1 SDR family NAD(P)-dependent oxidoreductase [Alkalicoccus luteus]
MKQKTILITGCSSGIGRFTAMKLAEENNVYATVRNVADKLELEKAGMSVLIGDITSVSDRKKWFESIENNAGKLNMLIHNAGICEGGVLASISEERMEQQFQVNVTAAAALSTVMLPLLRQAAPSAIVHIGSISGRTSFPGIAVYGASKAALYSLSRSLHIELAPQQIASVYVELDSMESRIWQKGRQKAVLLGGPYKKLEQKLSASASEIRKSPEKSGLLTCIMNIDRRANPKPLYICGRKSVFLHMINRLFGEDNITRMMSRIFR